MKRQADKSPLRLDLLARDVQRGRGARTLRELARELDISAATLSRVERGREPDLATFALLCWWLDKNPGRYLGLTTGNGAL